MLRTTNGDLAYASTQNKNLDFFGSASSLRGNPNAAVSLFQEAYKENVQLALANLLYLRDIRGGAGERHIFRRILVEMATSADLESVEVVKNIIPYIGEIGRYDDLLVLLYTPIKEDVLKYIHKVLIEDLKSIKNKDGNISLMAKWLPSINTSSDWSRKTARIIANSIFDGEYKTYRKMLSRLRKEIGVIERNLSEKKYDFEYSKITGKNLIGYRKAFTRNDGVRFNKFKASLKNNKEVVSSKVNNLLPYEITRSCSKDPEYYNALWDALPKEPSNKNILVVRDGSGSMNAIIPGTNTAVIDIANSLAIYSAERLPEPFKNGFITFSCNPKWVELPDTTLQEKLNTLSRHFDPTNTNIEKTYEMILELSKSTSEESRIDYVLIISDGQFDCPFRDSTKSTYDNCVEMFAEAGIPMPKMIFWNLNVDRVSFPTTELENVLLVSGFNKNIFQEIMKSGGFDAVGFMTSVLSRYNSIVENIIFGKEFTVFS